MKAERKGRRAGRKRSTSDIKARLRAVEAVKLKTAGYSYDEIAAQLGYASRSGAFGAVKSTVDAWESESVDQMRKQENARLDRLLKAHEPFAIGGDTGDKDPDTGERVTLDPNAQHADIVLKTIRERARLNGLDAPQKMEHEIKHPASPEEAIERVKRILAENPELASLLH